MFAKLTDQPWDAHELDARVRAAREQIVGKQRDLGVDVINDGEVSKVSYVTYIQDRFDGFTGQVKRVMNADIADYPEVVEGFTSDAGMRHLSPRACESEIRLRDEHAVHRDIHALRQAAGGDSRGDVFMTAISPGAVTMLMTNHYYPSHEAYLVALADALSYEYRAIVEAGLILQIDCPDLGCMAHVAFPDAGPEEHRRLVDLHIDVLNSALTGLPPERMRMHVCWGNYNGPHHRDIELRVILGSLLRAAPQGLLLEAANPRHEHEWAVFSENTLPEGKILIPGVVDTTNNYIEHPDLVAQRILRYANVVGRDNVMAGSDCGFSSLVGYRPVAPAIAWQKLRMVVEGARRASRVLWS